MVWLLKKQKHPCNQPICQKPAAKDGQQSRRWLSITHVCARVCKLWRSVWGGLGAAGRCWPPNNYCFIYFWFMMRAPTRLLRQGGNIKFVQLYFPTFASHRTAIILEFHSLDNDTFGKSLPLSFFSAIFRERPSFFLVHSCYISAYYEETAQ